MTKCNAWRVAVASPAESEREKQRERAGGGERGDLATPLLCADCLADAIEAFVSLSLCQCLCPALVQPPVRLGQQHPRQSGFSAASLLRRKKLVACCFSWFSHRTPVLHFRVIVYKAPRSQFRGSPPHELTTSSGLTQAIPTRDASVSLFSRSIHASRGGWHTALPIWVQPSSRPRPSSHMPPSNNTHSCSISLPYASR